MIVGGDSDETHRLANRSCFRAYNLTNVSLKKGVGPPNRHRLFMVAFYFTAHRGGRLSLPLSRASANLVYLVSMQMMIAPGQR